MANVFLGLKGAVENIVYSFKAQKAQPNCEKEILRPPLYDIKVAWGFTDHSLRISAVGTNMVRCQI